MNKTKITIHDVAKESGVSVATVSRFLNNKSGVSKKAKEKMKTAIKELNYKPYALAKGLSISTVGILIPDIKNLYYSPTIMGIEDGLSKFDYNIFVCYTYENTEREKKHIKTLIEKNVDGIIYFGPIKKSSIPLIKELSKVKPILLMFDDILGLKVHSVMADSLNGSYAAVTYLVKLGHKKIAIINGSKDYKTYQNKFNGYRSALTDNGIELNKNYIINEIPYEEGGFEGTNKLLSLKDKPTAIFTASDQIAIGVYKAILKAGYSIPKDFSVIGYGGIHLASELYPELTTMDQFPYQIGSIAAEKIINIINRNKITERLVLIEPEIAIRESCKSLL